jgi:hypothetical protein
MSLQTTSRAAARRLANQLNLTLDDVAMLADGADPYLTRSQIETMLHAVVDGHLAKLDRVAFAAKSSWGFDIGQAKADDRRVYWAYALLDAQGVTAVVRGEDRERMAADGLCEADIEAVQDHLAMLRVNELIPTKPSILRGMIEGVAATPTAMNLAVAQGTYLRGMKLALAQTDRRYGGARIEDNGLVDRIVLAKSDPPKPISSRVGPVEDRPADPPRVDAPTIPQFIPMADFTQFAERVARQNDADDHWDNKTQQQAKSISNLFVKFVVQDLHIHDLNLLRQEHVGKFVDFLRFDIYKHYGKSVRDEQLTIEQLREKGRSVEQAKRGIAGDTLKRHLTLLGQIFDYAIARGTKSLEGINLAKLRGRAYRSCEVDLSKGPLHQLCRLGQTRQMGRGGGRTDLPLRALFRPDPHLLYGREARRTLRSDGGRRHLRSRRLQALHSHRGQRAAAHQESPIQAQYTLTSRADPTRLS